jgi:hypothetical protein
MLATARPRALLLAVVVAGLTALPASALAVPPSNDNYLQSLSINQRGQPLTEETVRDVRSTLEATTQADLFSPTAAGGGLEPTDCNGVRYGATVWYDFHPHADGTVRVQAAGFDAAIAVYEYDPATSRVLSRTDCSNQAGTTEELFLKVKKGKSYTIQIGGTDAGLGPAMGNLDFLFEYLSDSDGDGVLDALDKCPKQRGSTDAAGCPAVLLVNPSLRANPTSNGIRIRSLSVTAPKGSRVQAHCRKGCTFYKSRTVVKGPVSFGGLAGRALKTGSSFEVFVTKADSIGTVVRWTVTRGNVKRTIRCLKPRSLIPRKTCK